VGDFVRTIGDGVSGLVVGSIHALSVAFDTIVGTLQAWLPGAALSGCADRYRRGRRLVAVQAVAISRRP
jgi:hypothetical protein